MRSETFNVGTMLVNPHSCCTSVCGKPHIVLSIYESVSEDRQGDVGVVFVQYEWRQDTNDIATHRTYWAMAEPALSQSEAVLRRIEQALSFGRTQHCSPRASDLDVVTTHGKHYFLNCSRE